MTKKKAVKKANKEKKKVDIEELVGEALSRIDLLGEKLDTLLSKSAVILRMIGTEKDPGFKTEATVTKKFPIPRDRDPRERKMYKAVCADCKAECEVPFVPRPERPVYCKACYSNRRNENKVRNLPNRDEIAAEIAKTFQIAVPDAVISQPGGKASATKVKTSCSRPRKKEVKKPADKARASAKSKTKSKNASRSKK